MRKPISTKKQLCSNKGACHYFLQKTMMASAMKKLLRQENN